MDFENLLKNLRASCESNGTQILPNLEELYRKFLGREIPLCKCKNRLHDATIELYIYIKKNYKTMDKITTRTAQLKSGCVLRNVPNYKGFFTNANLTDEVARAFLAKYPNKDIYFAVLPPEEVVVESDTDTPESVKVESDTPIENDTPEEVNDNADTEQQNDLYENAETTPTENEQESEQVNTPPAPKKRGRKPKNAK